MIPTAVPMMQPQMEMTTTVVNTTVVAPMGMGAAPLPLADRLQNLAQLRQQGVLSQEEFEKAKAQEIASGY